MLWTQNALETVGHLSGQQSLDIDVNQSNRYCVLLNCPNGKCAYYFSTPIYHISTGRLITRKFQQKDGSFRFVGSCSELNVTSAQIMLQDQKRTLTLTFDRAVSFRLQNGRLYSDSYSLMPTFNGVLIEGDADRMSFGVQMNFSNVGIRTRQSCVTVMESNFRPIAVLSAMVSQNQNGVHPAVISFEKSTDRTGRFSIFPGSSGRGRVMLEINFYEPKLMQDTPVSARFPNENNAFGPVAFIGKTSFFGVQWLYSRLDLNKLPELNRKLIRNMTLYIPKYTGHSMAVQVYTLPNRFCSFGSNWNNKVSLGALRETNQSRGDYLSLDLTSLYVSRNRLSEADGFVLAPCRNMDQDYLAVSTGDSYAMPQVLCVKY